MASITIPIGHALPRYCAASGNEGATVKMEEEISYGFHGADWFFFLVLGGFFSAFLAQRKMEKNITVTYFLTPAAHQRLLFRRTVAFSARTAFFLSFLLPALAGGGSWWFVPVGLFFLTVWLQRFHWPFVVEECTGSTLTLRGLATPVLVSGKAAGETARLP